MIVHSFSHRLQQLRFPYAAYMDRHKCIFIHIPRTGGSTIRTLLGAPVPGRMHLPWSIYRQANPKKFDDYFKFAFVRHPLERVLSAYSYLLAGGNGKGDLAAAGLISQFGSFDTFVRDGLLNGTFLNHVLFVAQSYFVCDYSGAIKVDFLGRMASFGADCREICSRLSLAREVPHCNASRREIGIGAKVNREPKRIIEQIYHRDYVAFGYK